MNRVYKGSNNKKCPLCKRGAEGGNPVEFVADGVTLSGNYLCPICYSFLQDQFVHLSHERHMEKFENVISEFLGPTIPTGRMVKGFYYSVYERGSILIINTVKDE